MTTVMTRWLVQTADGNLHGYLTREILLCDLAANRGEAVAIYELQPGYRIQYAPVTEEQIRASMEAAS